MSETAARSLSSYIRVKHGFAFPGAGFSDDPSLPTLLTPGNFALGGGFKEARTKTYAGDYPYEYKLSAGDLIISMTDLSKEGDTLGLPAVVPLGNYLHNQRVGLVQITDPENVHRGFLNYFLRTSRYRDYILGTASGSTVRHTSPSRIEAFEVVLPPVNQQRAIAEVLGALDDKIAANTKLAVNAATLGRALYQSAINRPDAVDVQLRDVAKNVAGKYLAKEDYVSDGPYFVYGSNSVMGRHDRALQQGGFAVLAKIGSYCGNLRWSQRPAWVNNNASAIVPMTGTEPSILRHGLDLVDMTPHRAGTGQPYIRMESLFSAELRIPASDVTSATAPILESLSELETRLSEENLTLASTRDALLPQLMFGNLRVKDADKALEQAGV